jgi:iron-sulfur cluster repair protein YtfE (RIC family)
MTITESLTTTESLSTRPELVTFDLYRAIHKGIRAELFALTESAGTADTADRMARAALADHVGSVAALLESHAHKEDAVIDPILEVHLPDLAERITVDHAVLDGRISSILDMARSAVDAPAVDQVRLGHWLYLDLATFTSDYLEHQDLEERIVMPALEAAVGVEAVMGIHGAIMQIISPDEMARTLALMLPTMNADERFEMLAGIRMAAPPEAFAGTVSLARSVLRPDDFARLDQRLAAN